MCTRAGLVWTKAGWWALAAAWLALLAVAAACGGSDGKPIVVRVPTGTPVDVTATPVRTTTPTPSPTGTPIDVCTPNPDPAPPSLLQVEEPKPQQKVGVPFAVRGWGSSIGLRDAGVAVAVVNAQLEVVQVLNVPPQPRAYRVPPRDLTITDFSRPFAADIVLTLLTSSTPICLWVYLETGPDGSPKGVVQVPVVVAR